MYYLKKLWRWIKWDWTARALPEPDRAKLNFIGSQCGYLISNGALDLCEPHEVPAALADMRDESTTWAIIVSLTREQDKHWWIHRIIQIFGAPVCSVRLQDGRRCFCTWSPL
jgi:hypothetical protein